ncbi:MAG TPA: hypothetical protein PKN52_03380 [Trueperaceae bacterium]|nr:hypothetical protein [Trueperaceae bacterium]
MRSQRLKVLAALAGVLVRLALAIGAWGAIVYGVSRIHEPAAWIVGGALLWLDLFISSRERPKP